MRCEFFKKTKIKCPPEKEDGYECQICPLREEETGDCLEDISQDAGDMLGKTSIEILRVKNERMDKIWRKYYAGKNSAKN